jgi:hypothetical protein
MRFALPGLVLVGSFVLVACGGGTQRTEAQVPASTASATTLTDAPPPPTASVAAPPPKPFCEPFGNITFQGGQGTSMADAIKIVGAKGEMDGVASEYACLDSAFGSRKSGAWKLLRQSLLEKHGKNYDLMSVELADGTKKEILFDISDYFGKF